MVTTFIFDIGNVVWFYEPLLDRLLHRWASLSNLSYDEFYSHYLSFYEYLETNQKTLNDFTTYLYHVNSKPFYSALDEIYSEENYKHYLNIPVLNLIKNLRSIHKVGYLSNAENFFYEYIHQKLNVDFDFGYTSWQLGLEKPNPEIFIKTLQLQNLKPEEVIFIDDTLKNITSAESIGIKSIHFQSNDQFLSELQQLDIKN